MNSLDHQVRILKKVFKNENGSQGTLYLVTNDLESSYEDIITTYQKRWHVECYHKSLKSNLGALRSPTKKEKSQINHLFCSMIAFSRLEKMKLSLKENHFAIKRKIHVYCLQKGREDLTEIEGVVRKDKCLKTSN